MSVRWQSHPVVDDYPRSIMAVAIIAAVCFAVYAAFQSVGYVLLSVVVLGASLSRYFLPTDYELDDQGISVRFLGKRRRTAWDEFHRYDRHKDGLFLSPFEERSRLDSFRGTFLRFRRNAEEVTGFVERKIQACDKA